MIDGGNVLISCPLNMHYKYTIKKESFFKIDLVNYTITEANYCI